MSACQAEVERILRHTATRRRKIEQQRSEAAGALGAAVRAAAGTGMSKTRIAEVSKLSRQTVHEMLRS